MYIEESISTCPLLWAQFTKLLSKITESKIRRLLILKPVCLRTWSGVSCLHSPFWFSKILLHSHPQVYLCAVMLHFMNEMVLLSSVTLYYIEIANYAADT